MINLKRILGLILVLCLSISILCSCSSNSNENDNSTINDNSKVTTDSSESNNYSEDEPYIIGVHDITVPVDTDFNAMVNKLISGVTGSGYISCDYSSVDLTSPGKYIVTFTSDDGVTETCTVTVTE